MSQLQSIPGGEVLHPKVLLDVPNLYVHKYLYVEWILRVLDHGVWNEILELVKFIDLGAFTEILDLMC